jgi:hypothetical protein
LSLKRVLGFGVAVRAQVVSLRRLVLAFPRLVAVIPYRANALVRHSNPLLRVGCYRLHFGSPPGSATVSPDPR